MGTNELKREIEEGQEEIRSLEEALEGRVHDIEQLSAELNRIPELEGNVDALEQTLETTKNRHIQEIRELEQAGEKAVMEKEEEQEEMAKKHQKQVDECNNKISRLEHNLLLSEDQVKNLV